MASNDIIGHDGHRTVASFFESIVHAGAATALTSAVGGPARMGLFADFAEKLASSLVIACASATAVHFLKAWLEKRKS